MSEGKPLVSIILPVYNGREHIRTTLESIFNQTYSPVEVIVIDDGSTDGTFEKLKEFKASLSERDKVNCHIVRQENQGAPRARNNGVAMSKGEYLLFVDADTILYPQCVEKMVETLASNSKASYAYCDYKMVGWREGYHKAQPFDAELLRKTNYISCTSLIRKEHFPGWDPKIKGLQDWDLWLTMLDNGYTGVYIPEVLFEAIQREDSITGSWVRNHWAEAISSVLAKHQKIAIFTLTKDRLEYTERMFTSLDKYTHIPYTHFIVDQGSTDGTRDFLMRMMKERNNLKVIFNEDNKGISIGSNQALDAIGNDFDYIMKLDNDCEILTDDWLYELVKLIIYSNNVLVLSPYVEGLVEHKGGVPRYFSCKLLGHPVGLTFHLGGISVISASSAYNGFRFDENDTLSGTQDVSFSRQVINKGYLMGYVEDIRVEHMDTTTGQKKKFPQYFKQREEVESKKSYKETKKDKESLTLIASSDKEENINTPEYWNKRYDDKIENEKEDFDPYRFQAILEFVPAKSKLLDVGCGLGEFLRYTKKLRPGVDLYGVDFSEKAINFNREKDQGKISYEVSSAYSLPFQKNSFDIVTAGEVLEHLDDPEEFIKEARRVLKPGGRLLLTLPYEDRVRDPEHVRYYYREDLIDLLSPYFRFVEVFPIRPLGENYALVTATDSPPIVSLDLDDFAQDNHRLDLLEKLKESFPEFKITLFTIPTKAPAKWLESLLKLGFLEFALHGNYHSYLECQSWSKKEAKKKINSSFSYLYVPGFKAPYWAASNGLYEALKELGFWVADQDISPAPDYLPHYRYNWLINQPLPLFPEIRGHGHVQNVCGNGLEESFVNLINSLEKIREIVGGPISFRTANECVRFLYDLN